MGIDERLLEILCCPVSRERLTALSAEQLEQLNQRIESGELRYADGSAVAQRLEAGLITESGARAYRIDEGIPVMLAERGILTGSS